jgi:hypothetical protein
MCKWQVDDSEAQVKSSLLDCTWLEDLNMDLSLRYLRAYEAKRSKEQLYFFKILFYFLLIFLSLSFFLLPFFLIFYFLLIIFSFYIFFLLLPRTFAT